MNPGAQLSHALAALFDMHRLGVAALIHLDEAGVRGGVLCDLVLPDLIEDIWQTAQQLQTEVDAFGHAEVQRRRAA